MANSVDPDQTAPIGDDFSRRHFQMHFFLDALRFKVMSCNDGCLICLLYSNQHCYNCFLICFYRGSRTYTTSVDGKPCKACHNV